ncbi:MAG: FGGY-family carbohydrate kinase [Infirmifilum sp.]|uniref:FGGY-family carbohydrate kinase n=1 Tax=Infirmifilum TaxID=2856573 RepID=UPI003C70B918
MYAVIDVGTTGIKLSVYDLDGRLIHNEKFILGYEKLASGLIEQNSREILKVVKGFARRAKDKGAKNLGLAVYRASVVAWDKSGEPLTNIITWIDGRGNSVLRGLPVHVKALRSISKPLSYILSPDSPAVLMKWIYENISGLREKVKEGEAFLWTLDSYLLYNISGKFLSDATSITLTGLVHPRNFRDIGLVYEILGLPKLLPEVVDNVEEIGELEGLKVNAVIADQQAAAVGLGVVKRGRLESVHGTGSFLELCTGDYRMPEAGLIPIVILKDQGSITYGVEGFLRTTGSVVDWLRSIGFFKDYEEMEFLAAQGDKRLLFLPSFGGLRTPKANNISGLIAGLKLHTTRADLVASLAWGVALYMAYLAEAAMKSIKHIEEPMWVAGGFSKSDAFLQMLADATGIQVARPTDTEASSRGVLKLLMLGSGRAGREILADLPQIQRVFTPTLPEETRKMYMSNFIEILKVLSKWEKNIFLKRDL